MKILNSFFSLVCITAVFITSSNCSNQPTVIKTGQTDSTVVFTVKGNPRYLILPIEEKAPSLSLEIEGQSLIDLHLAQHLIDYYVPLELNGRKSFTLHINNHTNNSFALNNLKVADQFKTLNQEKHRPLYHFTADYGWVNDPNGMVYAEGLYHLFYQYNPYGSIWGNMTWGHAVSKDLVNWQRRPIAIEPDSLGTIFSGSAIVDHHNAAGFGKNAIITFYTSFQPKSLHQQVQSMAYSTDGGNSFTKYGGNPILKSDKDLIDFRDPKVIYYAATKTWIMALASGPQIKFFSSKNLKDWHFESAFRDQYNPENATWECPDLIQVPVDQDSSQKRWVLIVSHGKGPFGGSAVQYFTGDFDGHKFVCHSDPKQKKWMDYGKDHYATVTWSNTPVPLAIAWMSNWEYANDVPTYQYKGAMSLVRKLSLFKVKDEYYLASTPLKKQEELHLSKTAFTPFTLHKESHNLLLPQTENPGAYELTFEAEMTSADVFGFHLFNDVGESIQVFINQAENRIYLDRNKSGKGKTLKTFPTMTYAPTWGEKKVNLHLFVDKSSVELFLNGGKSVITDLIFPSEPYNRINFYSKGGSCKITNLTYYTYQESIK